MILSDGTNEITIKILPNFDKKIELGFNLVQLDSNKLISIDRGNTTDYYETTITIRGTISEIDNTLLFIQNARNNNILSFAVTLEGEPLFGENVDYINSNIVCSISKIDTRLNVAMNVYSVSLTLVAKSNTLIFKTYSGSPFGLLCVSHGAEEYSTWGYNFNLAYNTSNHFISDSDDDYGVFVGVLSANDNEMGHLRAFYRTQRGSPFSLSNTMLPGITKPFGPNAGSYPYDVIITNMEETYICHNRYNVTITLTQDV